MTVAVLGGGISGLAAAYYLRIGGYRGRVVLFEASGRLGGWIHSVHNEDGTLFEQGPRTLRVAGTPGANTLRLAEDLGLTEEIIHVPYGHPSTQNRMIRVGGRLHLLPNSFTSLFRTCPPFSEPLAWVAVKELFKKRVKSSDESVFNFINRRFGSEVATYVSDPLVRGIFAGDAKEVSVLSLARQLHEAEQEFGSVLWGTLRRRKHEKLDRMLEKSSLVMQSKRDKWAVWSLHGGLSTLVDGILSNIIDSVDILKNTAVKNLTKHKGKLYVETNSDTVEADSIISCIPSKDLKTVIKNINCEVASILNSIPYVSVAVVNLLYSKHVLNMSAFGYLVPSVERSNALGVIFDTCSFPQGEKTILTVMMGGYWFKEIFGDTPESEHILDLALQEVHSSLKLSETPSDYRVSVLRDCIPQYVVGHYALVNRLRATLHKDHLNLQLAGSSYDGVGVNDAIFSAKTAVNTTLRKS